MTNISYEKDLSTDTIQTATFSISDAQTLQLSIVPLPSPDSEPDDPEAIVKRKLKITIFDDDFGGEEMSVELDEIDSRDVLKVWQKLIRQLNA